MPSIGATPPQALCVPHCQRPDRIQRVRFPATVNITPQPAVNMIMESATEKPNLEDMDSDVTYRFLTPLHAHAVPLERSKSSLLDMSPRWLLRQAAADSTRPPPSGLERNGTTIIS